jgi:23S rRNA pseudouridine955/2504/2580 synthase
MKHFTVTPAEEGLRFDRWAKTHLPGVPYGLLQKHLRKGAVRLDGKRVKAEQKLVAGQVVAVRPEVLAASETPAPRPRTLPLEEAQKRLRALVIHEDARCLVLNKPAGLATQGGSGVKDSVDALIAAASEGDDRLRLVHRLDKDTSGVLVIAKGRKAAEELTRAFAAKDVQKIYWALVVGVPQPYEGIIDAPMEKIGTREKMELSEDGQRAVTEYVTRETLAGKLTWVELQPITGRTHQLRVHMAAIEHPIYGDGKYGGAEAFIDGMGLPAQLHLHARRIVMKGLDVTAPLPVHMKQSWKALGLSEPKK